MPNEANSIEESDAPPGDGLPSVLNRGILAAAICGFGLLLTLASWQWSRNRVRQHAEALFERQVALVSMSMRERMIDYETVLRSASAFFAGSERVERAEWRRFIEQLNLDQVYPGLHSVGFAPTVPRLAVAAFLDRTRADQAADFQLKAAEGGPVDAPLVPVLFNERAQAGAQNPKPLLGWNMLSDPALQETLQRALELGGNALSQPMATEPDGSASPSPWYVMMFPLLPAVSPAHTSAQHRRMEELIGVVFVSFHARDYMEGLLPPGLPGFRIGLVDADPRGAGVALYPASGAISRVGGSDALSRREETFSFGGRRWLGRFEVGPEFATFLNPVEPLAFLLGGLLTTALLCGTLWVESRTFVRASIMASRMTAELRALSAHVLRLQDEERGRIARDLHDSTVQTLGLASRNLAAVHEAAAADSPARASLSDSVQLVDTAVQDLRTLTYVLQPPTLELLGLPGALRDFVAGFSRRSGLEVQFSAPGDFGRLSPEAETALFRVTQEALANIHRHANSTRAQVRLERLPDAVLVSVVDDGIGIPPDLLAKINHDEARLGVGIAGMRERLRQLGGSLEIRRRARGTLVRASLPITRQMP